MVKVIEDNILNSPIDQIIVQQVNCQNAMGSGVAKAIYTKYPEVKEQYHKFCSHREPKDLLGSSQVVNCNDNRKVINIFGQLNYGRDGKLYTSYGALQLAFLLLREKSKDGKCTFAIPYNFGSGLAGGDFNIVKDIIEICLIDHDIIYYKI